jgi:hypothetical protein
MLAGSEPLRDSSGEDVCKSSLRLDSETNAVSDSSR